MDRLQSELQHMLRMLEPPFFEGWRGEMERKAQELEATDPDFAGLWVRLRQEVRARGWHKTDSVQQQSSSSSEQPSEQPGTATADPMPAPTSTTRQKASTGSRPTYSLEG